MNITDLKINIDNLKLDINLHKNNCILCVKEQNCIILSSYYESLNSMIFKLNAHKIKYMNYENKFNYESESEQNENKKVQKNKN